MSSAYTDAFRRLRHDMRRASVPACPRPWHLSVYRVDRPMVLVSCLVPLFSAWQAWAHVAILLASLVALPVTLCFAAWLHEANTPIAHRIGVSVFILIGLLIPALVLMLRSHINEWGYDHRMLSWALWLPVVVGFVQFCKAGSPLSAVIAIYGVGALAALAAPTVWN